MLAATACFAVAFLGVAQLVPFIETLMFNPLLLAMPYLTASWLMFTMGTGAGIGTLCQKRGRGVLIGLGVGFMPYLAFFLLGEFAVYQHAENFRSWILN